jgi:hypothetical protein
MFNPVKVARQKTRWDNKPQPLVDLNVYPLKITSRGKKSTQARGVNEPDKILEKKLTKNNNFLVKNEGQKIRWDNNPQPDIKSCKSDLETQGLPDE